MKTPLIVTILITLLIMSCEKKDNNRYDIGEGFEIYITKTPYSHNLYLDYSKVDFDSILLSDLPIFRYNDLIKYDTLTHKLTLAVSHDSIKFANAGVYGSMFVTTIDKVPIYCGFYWPVYSSVPCNWVYIEQPYYDLDRLDDKELVISFSSEHYTDPRLDRRIVNRLIKDRKIK